MPGGYAAFGRRPRRGRARRLVMAFGDSRSVSMGSASEGDSRTSYRRVGRAPLNWWAALRGHPVEVAAAGQAGQPSSVYVARWPTVRAQRPRVVLFHGIVNDVNAAFSSGAPVEHANGLLARACFDRLTPLADEVRRWGGVPVFCTEPLGTGTNQAARIAEAAIYDELIAGYARACGTPLCDLKTLMRVPDTAAGQVTLRAGYTGDGLHLAERGAWRIALDGLAPLLDPLFPAADALPAVPTGQVLANPWFQATTGGGANSGVGGVVPAGWLVDLSGSAGATATVATRPRSDQRGAMCVIDHVATAAGQNVRLRQDVTTALRQATAAIPGDARWRMEAEVEVDRPAALGAVSCLLSATINGTVVPTAMSSMELTIGSSLPGPDQPYALALRTPWFPVAAGSSIDAASARYVAVASGAGSAQVAFGVTRLTVVPA